MLEIASIENMGGKLFLNRQKKFKLFDADFRSGHPVYDRGRSKTALVCDRGNIQPDGQGGTVAVDTPVLDSALGLRTNGGYTNEWYNLPDNGSEPTAVTGFSSAVNISIVSFDWPAVISSGKAVAFGNNSMVRDFRLSVPMDTGAEYILGCYIVMDDGGVPVPSTSSLAGDFMLYRRGNYARTIHIKDSLYFCFINLTAVDASDSFGLYKTTNNSDRGFKASGFVFFKSTYPMPYVKTEDAPVTVDSNYSYDDAGTQKGPHFKLKEDGQVIPAMQSLFDVLDGKADGVELVTNGGFDTGGLEGYTSTSGQYGVIDNMCVINRVGEGYARLGTSANLTIGARYEARVSVISNNGATCLLHNDWVVGQYLSTHAGNNVFRFTATTTGFGIEISGDGKTVVFDDISIRLISPATGVIEDTWRPGFDYTDLDNLSFSNIWSVTGQPADGSFYAYNDGETRFSLKDSDGNIAKMYFSWLNNTDYLYRIIFGDHPVLGSQKMQIQVMVNGSWLASPVVNFSGSFGPVKYLSFGTNTIFPQHPTRHLTARGYVLESDWKEAT